MAHGPCPPGLPLLAPCETNPSPGDADKPKQHPTGRINPSLPGSYDDLHQVDDNATPANTADDLTQHEYVYGPDYVDEFILESQKTVSAQQDFYVLQDANFNVMALTDAGGGVVEQYQWEPYGLLAAKDTDTGGTIPHSHIGHQGLFFYRFDDAGGPVLATNAEGLYFNRNRWYSPSLGRFTSKDPVETSQLVLGTMLMNGQSLMILAGTFDAAGHFGDGMNLFAYLTGDPVVNRDPTGMFFTLPDLAVSSSEAAYLHATMGMSVAVGIGGLLDALSRGMGMRDAAYQAAVWGAEAFITLGAAGEMYFLMSESLWASAGAVATGTAVAGETIGQMLAQKGVNVSPNALVNFGSRARDVIQPTLSGKSYWFRVSDILNMRLTQVQTVIGNMASAGQPGGANVMRVSALGSNQFASTAANAAGIVEYTITVAVPVAQNITVGGGDETLIGETSCRIPK